RNNKINFVLIEPLNEIRTPLGTHVLRFDFFNPEVTTRFGDYEDFPAVLFAKVFKSGLKVACVGTTGEHNRGGRGFWCRLVLAHHAFCQPRAGTALLATPFMRVVGAVIVDAFDRWEWFCIRDRAASEGLGSPGIDVAVEVLVCHVEFSRLRGECGGCDT